jgi:hypothetical protein
MQVFGFTRRRMLIKNKRARRAVGGVLIVAGGCLMWLAPEVLAGVILLAAGIGLEVIGIMLEHRDSS